MMLREWTLFTRQANTRDLRVPHKPYVIYSDPLGPSYDMARYLGWSHWAWCFTELRPDLAPLMHLRAGTLREQNLWILRVPSDHIKWIGVEDTIRPWDRPFEEIIHDTPHPIAAEGDIYQAIIQIPIHPSWVVAVIPCYPTLLGLCYGVEWRLGGDGAPWSVSWAPEAKKSLRAEAATGRCISAES